MSVTASIFLDLNLPNPPTWFYFSALLAVALFFKFSRLLSMRNLDVVTLFLPMPGFLLLVEADQHRYAADLAQRVEKQRRAEGPLSPGEKSAAAAANEKIDLLRAAADRLSSYGYLALLGVSLYFLVRCLLDLTLVRRPALGPNLDLGGLAWLAGALFVSLIAVAVRQPAPPPDPAGKSLAPTDKVVSAAEKALPPAAAASLGDTNVSLWVARGLALACHLSIAVGLVLVGWLHFDDLRSGMSAATFYLLLPYTYLLLPGAPRGIGSWDHAWAMALMIWAVFTYRRPTLAGMFLGLAAGSAFFPLLAFPVWLSFYRRGGAGRFAVSFVLFLALWLAVVLSLNQELPSSFRSAWTESAWQPWRRPDPATRGFWQLSGNTSPAYRLPVFLASMALVVITAFWPTPKNLAHVLALSAAVLISVQFWYANQGGAYVLWYLPFLLLLMFRPNLTEAQPPPPAEDDWIGRLVRRVRRWALRWWRPTEPAMRLG
jgi:hypothetical protein